MELVASNLSLLELLSLAAPGLESDPGLQSGCSSHILRRTSIGTSIGRANSGAITAGNAEVGFQQLSCANVDLARRMQGRRVTPVKPCKAGGKG